MSKNQTIPDKSLPSAIDTEIIILGAILIDNKLIAQAVEKLTPEYFYNGFHRFVFDAMINLFAENKPIDPLLISEKIKRMNVSVEFSDIKRIGGLTYGMYQFSDISEFINIVLDKAKLRGVIKAANEIQGMAIDDSDETQTILDFAQSRINEVCADTTKKGFSTIGDEVIRSAEVYKELRQSGITHTGLLTGFKQVDNLTNGLQKGELIILAARPRIGKTSFVLNIAENVCELKPDAVVAFFTLEMSKKALAKRALCASAQVNADRFNRGICLPDEERRINEAIVKFSSKKIEIDDTPAISPVQIRSKAMMLKAEHKRIDLIIVDFLQKMSPSRRKESARLEYASIAQELKNLAKDLDVPVIALSSLNRECEKRNPPKPIMSDLSESNAIESEADIVAFLFRASVYDKAANPRHGEIIFAKNRNGEERTIELGWMGEFTKFEDY